MILKKKLKRRTGNSNVQVMRTNLQNRRNYNLLAGDQSYTTNFFLRFSSGVSETRFVDDCSVRHLKPLRYLIGLSIVYSVYRVLAYDELSNTPCSLVMAYLSYLFLILATSFTR